MPLNVTDISSLSAELVEQAEEFVVDFAGAAHPELDLSKGSVLRQLLVAVAAQFHALNQQNLDRITASGSLKAITADPTMATDEVVDAVLSNFMVTRRTGSVATGQATVLLSRLETTFVQAGLTLTVDDIVFNPSRNYTAVTTEAEVVADGDRTIRSLGNGQFAITIEVTAAAAGDAGNVRQGTAFTMATVPANVLQVLAAEDFDGGSDTETNAQLLARMQSGISAKTLASRLTIKSSLQANFDSVKDVSVMGAGDGEQRRDKHSRLGITTGGKVDVYIRTRTFPRTLSVTTSAVLEDASTSTWSVNLDRDTAPGAYDVLSVRGENDELTEDPKAITALVRGLDLSLPDGHDVVPDIATAAEGAFSRYQTLIVRFTDANTSGVAEGGTRDYVLDVLYMPEIAEISDFVLNRDNRPPAGDYLVKAPVPCFVAVGLSLVAGPGDEAVDTGVLKTAVAAAVNGVDFLDGRLPASKIVNAVQALLPGRTRLKTPLDLRGVISGPDSTDRWLFDANELRAPQLDTAMISPRTVAFFCDPADVTIDVLPADNLPT